MSKQRGRKKCVCTEPLGPDGLCPYRCDLYVGPASRVRAAERGAREDKSPYLSRGEAVAGEARAGVRLPRFDFGSVTGTRHRRSQANG